MGLVALHPVATPNFDLSQGSMRAKKRENRGGNDGKFCRKEQKFFDFCLFFLPQDRRKKWVAQGCILPIFYRRSYGSRADNRPKWAKKRRKSPFFVGWISAAPSRLPTTPGTAKVGELRGVSSRLTHANYATCGLPPKHPIHLPHECAQTAASPLPTGKENLDMILIECRVFHPFKITACPTGRKFT